MHDKDARNDTSRKLDTFLEQCSWQRRQRAPYVTRAHLGKGMVKLYERDPAPSVLAACEKEGGRFTDPEMDVTEVLEYTCPGESVARRLLACVSSPELLDGFLARKAKEEDAGRWPRHCVQRPPRPLPPPWRDVLITGVELFRAFDVGVFGRNTPEFEQFQSFIVDFVNMLTMLADSNELQFTSLTKLRSSQEGLGSPYTKRIYIIFEAQIIQSDNIYMCNFVAQLRTKHTMAFAKILTNELLKKTHTTNYSMHHHSNNPFAALGAPSPKAPKAKGPSAPPGKMVRPRAIMKQEKMAKERYRSNFPSLAGPSEAVKVPVPSPLKVSSTPNSLSRIFGAVQGQKQKKQKQPRAASKPPPVVPAVAPAASPSRTVVGSPVVPSAMIAKRMTMQEKKKKAIKARKLKREQEREKDLKKLSSIISEVTEDDPVPDRTAIGFQSWRKRQVERFKAREEAVKKKKWSRRALEKKRSSSSKSLRSVYEKMKSVENDLKFVGVDGSEGE